MNANMIVAGALLAIARAPIAAPDAAPLQIGWLGTQLTPGTTAAFEVPVNAQAPRYRVSVFAFDWVQRGRGLN